MLPYMAQACGNMNEHEKRIEEIVVLSRRLWDGEFIERGGLTWEQFEAGLRRDLASMSAAEVVQALAVMKF